ncbi:MAG: 3-phosphoglycerate dehydrogenase [Crocinitomicaceae bacterium]|nr:3-phosphoglycerate dehydrogenase [Crocinitomicaceae bacterium]
MKVLANDGISAEGVAALEGKGFSVSTTNVAQDSLEAHINAEGIEVLLVRSATTVREALIDACPSLKIIGRGGVGMDNIDVDYARGKGLKVINTPGASSQSVAELVLGQMFSLSRSAYDSNREMPTNGAENFKVLKKKYAKGQELRGKTLGIIGFGRIGQALAGYALGVGMNVKAVDLFAEKVNVPVLVNGNTIDVEINPVKNLGDVIGELDYISIHVPKQADGSPVITASEIGAMKDGVIIANAARGGVVDEDALIEGLNSGKIRAAALDVFENEPTPRKDLLVHDKIASTPHIGAATTEAQSRIGVELAEQIFDIYGV